MPPQYPPPLVSVCIPAYNCSGFLQKTLDCLCRQSHGHLEIIIVNDGSTDDTLAIAKGYNDIRIIVVDTMNGGAAKARNIAYQHATGDYIIFFDADDYVPTDFIQQQLNAINQRNNVVALAAWGRFYNDDTSTYKPEPLPAQDMLFSEWINYYWYNCNPMTNPGRVIIPAAIIEKAGLWNESLSLNDDLEFFTRIFLQAEKIIFNPAAKFYYRSGVNGLSAIKGFDAYQSLYNSISLSVQHVLAGINNERQLLKSCANMWQLFIYDSYPLYPELLEKAQLNINALGSSDLKYHSGRMTNILSRLLGWKAAKKIRSLL